MWKPKYFLVVFISHKNTKPDPTNLPNLKEKTHTNNLPTSPKGNKPRKKKKKKFQIKIEIERNYSILIRATLLRLGIILTKILKGVRILEAVTCVAGGGAELLHLIPRRRALAARRILRARLLCVLYALHHLLRYPVRCRRHRSNCAHPTGGPLLPWVAEPGGSEDRRFDFRRVSHRL